MAVEIIDWLVCSARASVLFGYEIILSQVYRNTERETPVQGAHHQCCFSLFIVFQRKNLHRTWVKLRRKISGSLKRSIFYRRGDCLIVWLAGWLVRSSDFRVVVVQGPQTNETNVFLFSSLFYLGNWINTPRSTCPEKSNTHDWMISARPL